MRETQSTQKQRSPEQAVHALSRRAQDLEALSIKEQVLGAFHPEVGMTLNNLAVFYKTARQYEKADAYYQRALPVLERGLGPKHPKVAVTLENYTKLLRKIGRTEDVRAPVVSR